MRKENRERIVLKCYPTRSLVLAEPVRGQKESFRKQVQTEPALPREGLRKIRVSMRKLWLRKDRKGGFNPLKPPNRPKAPSPHFTWR